MTFEANILICILFQFKQWDKKEVIRSQMESSAVLFSLDILFWRNVIPLKSWHVWQLNVCFIGKRKVNIIEQWTFLSSVYVSVQRCVCVCVCMCVVSPLIHTHESSRTFVHARTHTHNNTRKQTSAKWMLLGRGETLPYIVSRNLPEWTAPSTLPLPFFLMHPRAFVVWARGAREI